MGENGDFFQEKWGKSEIAQENGEIWGKMGKYGKIPREKWRNTLGRTCFQAFLQTEVGCDLTSLAALRSLHVQAPELTRIISLRNSLYIFIFWHFVSKMQEKMGKMRF